MAWAKTVLGRVNPEKDGWDILKEEYLGLIVTVSEHDKTWQGTVIEILPSIEAEYEKNNDFELILPLIRAYELLGRQAELAALQETFSNSESRHPMWDHR